MSIHEKCIFGFRLKNCPFLGCKDCQSDNTEGLSFPPRFCGWKVHHAKPIIEYITLEIRPSSIEDGVALFSILESVFHLSENV